MIDINIEIEGKIKTFQMPTQWSDITVGQYEKIFAINKDNMTEIEYFVQIYCALTGCEPDLAYDMDINDFKTVMEQLSFTATPIKEDSKDSIFVQNGDLEEEYFLKKDFKTLTLGESISIEALMKKHNNRLEQCVSELLCVFLRKKDSNGELEAFKNHFMKRQEIFKQVPITDIYQMFVFFSIGKGK